MEKQNALTEHQKKCLDIIKENFGCEEFDSIAGLFMFRNSGYIFSILNSKGYLNFRKGVDKYNPQSTISYYQVK